MKNKFELFPQQIATYWWNFGKKKKEFTGSISAFFKEKGITYREMKHKKSGTKGIRFVIPVGSERVQVDSYSFPQDAAISALKLFLTVLGDKAQIVTGSRIININH